MVYLDTSVAMARIAGEAASPPEDLWVEDLISSRLLEYETWSRLDFKGLTETHGSLAKRLLGLVSLLELIEPVVGRARRLGVLRTLDALHLASMLWLVDQGVEVRLASYDRLLNDAAERLGIARYPL
jgi:hypothetical protein